MNAPTYATREAFKAATGVTGFDSKIDRLLNSSSRQVDGNLRRHFFPIAATYAYQWPNLWQNTVLRLYLGRDLLEVTSITSGGKPMTSFVLQPYNDGPPYSRIEEDLSSNDAFSMAAIRQLSILIEATWGYSNDTAPVGLLVDTITDAQTDLEVPDAGKVGIGDLIFCGTEAMLVTDRALLDTTETLTAGTSDKNNDLVVSVTDGSVFFAGETIVVDSERMLITGIATDDLLVQRAYDGSVIAAHLTAAAVYVARTLTVERGAAGTTATAHTAADPITRNVPPLLISDLVLAEAITRFHNENAAYARSLVSNQSVSIEVTGKALKDLREQVDNCYYRARGPASI